MISMMELPFDLSGAQTMVTLAPRLVFMDIRISTGIGKRRRIRICLFRIAPIVLQMIRPKRSIRSVSESYAYQRIQQAHKMFQRAGLPAVWYETPHYTASSVQRHIIEICNGILYESPPSSPDARTAALQHIPDDPLTNGTIYVPTPLYYVAG